jgi:hypothetical protein
VVISQQQMVFKLLMPELEVGWFNGMLNFVLLIEEIEK